MPKSGFTRLKVSEAQLYGPKGLLVCGFNARAQSKFESLLAMLGFSALSLVWAAENAAQQTVGDLFALANGSGAGKGSNLPRAVVVAGIKEKELHRLMSGCRKAGMNNIMWATLTPTSENWPLGKLLDQLQAERMAMSPKK